ncbi:MAG TPA: TlpA disulfide reductase family protein [Humisphaera sp.]
MLNRRLAAALVPAVAAATLGFGLLAGPGTAGAASPKPAAAKAKGESIEGKPAPAIELDRADGKKFSLAAEKGNVVVLDFWATWCPPCRKSLPHIEAISADAKLAEKGLRVYAVNLREDKGKIDPFLKDNKYSFAVPMDVAGKAAAAYGVAGIPTTVIVGRDGKVKNVFVGFGEGSEKRLDDAIAAALAEK